MEALRPEAVAAPALRRPEAPWAILAAMVEWLELAERERARFDDGERRLPGTDDSDSRQRQLTRMANAAVGAGLALLMAGRAEDAAAWLGRGADAYRRSYDDAPPGSWGRLIGETKARVLAGDWEGAERAAAFALEQAPGESDSPIGRYAAALALLVLGRDVDARRLAGTIRERDDFPHDVADALATLAAGDPIAYMDAVESVLESFERRTEFLEDVPVADTVVVLQALARRRALEVELSSALLPPS